MATRRERVVLEIEDDLSPGLLRAAAAAKVLDAELNSLSGRAVQTSRGTARMAGDLDRTSASAGRADKSINQLTGRLRLFADAAAILGPGTVPIGGVLAAGVAGFASQLGFAAVAGGVLVGSMQGLGDALGALNDAHLEPTAENLAKAEDALNKLSPAAAKFAEEAYAMAPALRAIRDMGAEALFPGLTASLDDLERLAPVVGRIFETVGGALGDIAEGGAASLASERWAGFFEFIATEAPRALSELASTVGSVTHGLGELWMAFAPLNRDTSSWLMDVAAGFDAWATGLAQTDGFRDFIAYIQTTGPQVADTLGALANAVVQIVQAASPLGGAVLAGIEGFANAISAIADSGFGPALLGAAAALAIFTRGMALVAAASVGGLAALNPWVLGIGAAAGILLAVEQKADAAAGGIDRFNEAIKAADVSEANASIVEMQKRLDELKGTDMASITFSSFGNLTEGISVQDEIDALTASLAGSKSAVADLTAEQERAAASDSYYNAILAETAALEDNIAAMQAKRDEALRSFSAETNYAQALLDAKAALADNGRAWNLNTEAGLKNRRVVEQQASAWNDLNRTQGQSPAQARRARAALEETATSLGASKEEARQYARQLMDIPNDLKTKIALDVDTAIQRAQAIKAELASIDRNIDVYVNVRRPNAGGFGPQVGAYDTGGFTGRGGKHEVAGIVHRGEVVIPQELVKADWGMLRSRYGHLPGFADGGVVGASDSSAGKDKRARRFFDVTDNTDALQAALDRLTRRTDDQTAAVDAQRDALERSADAVDMWAGKMDQAGQNTLSNFGLDLFKKDSSNPWAANSGSSPLSNLSTVNAGLTERIGLQGQLAALGLSGDALSELLKGDNVDIAGMIQRGEIGQYATDYAQFQSLSATASQQAGQAAYGQQFAAAERDNRMMQDAMFKQLQEFQKHTGAITRLEGAQQRMATQIERLNADGPERTGAAVRKSVDDMAADGQRRKNFTRSG